MSDGNILMQNGDNHGFNHSLYHQMINIIKRAATQSCCLCRDECLTCDAKDVLKALELYKTTNIPQNAAELVLGNKDGS